MEEPMSISEPIDASSPAAQDDAAAVPPQEPAVDVLAVTAQLNSMFNMAPLTSVIATLLAALNEQKQTINNLTVTLAAAEAKTTAIAQHVSAVEGEAAAAKDRAASLSQRIAALESRPSPRAQEGYLESAPPDTEQLNRLIAEQMEAAQKQTDEALLRRFEEHKKGLPDYNSICDSRINIYFGNSELLKDFSKKINTAHAAVEKFPALESQAKELQGQLDTLAAAVGPQNERLGARVDAAESKAQGALDIVQQLHGRAVEEERLRQRAREARAAEDRARASQASSAAPSPKSIKGVPVITRRNTSGIVKVASSFDANALEEQPATDSRESVVLDQSDEEDEGSWVPPGEEKAAQPEPKEPEEHPADRPIDEDIQELAEEVAQIVEESIEECFDELSVADEPEPEIDFEPDRAPVTIPKLPVEAARADRVVVAHTRDITHLEKTSSFQYTRPVKVEDASMRPQSFSAEEKKMSSRPPSGPKSAREDEASARQLSARRKQMLKDTLHTRMNSMDIPALVEKGEKHGERVKIDPANSLASRLRVVEEILAKLPATLSSSMDTLRQEVGRHGVVAVGAAGPNLRNEMIQIMQTTEGVRKKVAHLEETLNGVIQASLDGQALNANVKPQTEEEAPPAPIIQYVEAPPAAPIVTGPSSDEVAAQIKTALAEASRELVTHKQCHDLLLAALDKPRAQYASASEVASLAEWRKTAAQMLERLDAVKADKEETATSFNSMKADVGIQMGHVKQDVVQTLHEIKQQETEALIRLQAKMDSLTSYVGKLDVELATQLRPILHGKSKAGSAAGASGDRDLESKMALFETKSRQIQSMQMDQIQRLVDSLQNVETELRSRPKEKQIQAMVRLIEDEFRKQLGNDVGDIQSTINRIVSAVHSKANKGEVVKLISSSIAHVQLDISKINGGEIPAGGYKCLSCGHNGATVRLMSGAPHPDDASVGHRQSSSAADDASIDSAVSMLSDPSTAAVLSRSAGLRPLGGFSEPQDPKVMARAEKKRAAQKHINRRPTTTQEPLYRRARLAAQLKEIPKVTPVDLGHLPQYAMDDDISMESMGSVSSLQRNDLHSRSNPSSLKLPQVHSSPSPGKSSMLGETERLPLDDTV